MWVWPSFIILATIVTLTSSDHPYPGNSNYAGQNPPTPANKIYSGNNNGVGSIEEPQFIGVEVIAILPDHSRKSLSLSNTLAHTLNSVSTSELLSQLEFPDKNITWFVHNFVVEGGNRRELQVLKGSPYRDYKGGLEEDKEEEGDEEDGDSLFEEEGGGGSSSEGDYNGDGDYFGDEFTSGGGNDSEGRGGGGGGGKRGRKRKRGRNRFSPELLSKLCDRLGGSKAVALVTLLGDPGSERLISLVSDATGIPLIGSAHSPTPPLQKDVDDLYINLSSSVRELARALAQLLLRCHWHSFNLLFDDSPSIVAQQSLWEEELLATPPSTTSSPGNTSPSSSNSSHNEFYETEDYEDGVEHDSGNSTHSHLLRPNIITIQTRFSNSAFRALSELTKATQGVIVLILSQRSAMGVFHAAKKLRMLNGDYVFILVGPYTQFERVPDWLPPGVLALRSPRISQIDKWRMRSTGSLLASALTSLKEVPLPLPQPLPRRRKKKKGSAIGIGGVFSGISEKDIKDSVIRELNQPQYETEEEDEEEEEPRVPIPDTEKEKKDKNAPKNLLDLVANLTNLSCYEKPEGFEMRKQISIALTREMRGGMSRAQPLSHPTYDLLNLVKDGGGRSRAKWVNVGSVSPLENAVKVDTIRWPGGGMAGPAQSHSSRAYRIVTVVSPPFVMESQAEDNSTCVRGLPCLKVNTQNKDELAVVFAEFEGRKTSADGPLPFTLACCDGFAMDLLASVARELRFDIDLFLVPDGYFGSRNRDGSWNGVMGALVSGAAHMSFAPFSVTSVRATTVDFSTPFFFSGVGLLGISKERDVPLLAFLAPFSPELWGAIFITLNLTALVVAIYEWFSPFGLNPWGRQRTKNFSISSALWVVWGRLFSHLVAFKAPKSWPNKFLINVWGGFSVIFVASYTANIAALFAGMFFERHVDVNDRSLLSQRVTAVKHSATDFYIKRENPHLWEHIQQFPVHSFQQGVSMLKNGSLDLLIGDGPLLDYYRGTDSSCSLIDVSDHDKIGDDTYAVAMTRGFPLKESVSSVIAKYLGNGYLDYLQGKWYGQMPCFSKSQQLGARALGVDAVVGMFIMLGMAMALGIIISICELIIFKHALPFWRSQPKGTLWRSPNVMFFSQKLYRFINCVELVSPHHAAKELASSLRQGQITSLFQKSVKRKEHEQRRRRKSKAQFYEMIQEIKRVQMAEKTQQRRSGFRDDESESTVYSIQGRMDGAYLPPRLTQTGTGEEILIAEYPEGARGAPAGAPSSIDDPPSISTSDGAGGNQKRIQWGRRTLASSPAPPHGILRRGLAAGVKSSPGLKRRISKNQDEEKVHEVQKGYNIRGIQREIEDDSDEEGEVSPPSDGDSYELYSPLDKADLNELSKAQIINMWRASELDLRRQLSQALKAKDELASQLTSRAETPAMVLEFDQVKI